MKAVILATVGLLALSCVPPTATANLTRLGDVFTALTLGVTEHPFELLDLMTRTSTSSLDAGEAAVFDDAWSDTAGILQLADLPPEFLSDLTLRQLGAIHGTHIEDISDPVLLAALTLADRPIAASSLRSTSVQASVRQEDPIEQARDLAALLHEGPP